MPGYRNPHGGQPLGGEGHSSSGWIGTCGVAAKAVTLKEQKKSTETRLYSIIITISIYLRNAVLLESSRRSSVVISPWNQRGKEKTRGIDLEKALTG